MTSNSDTSGKPSTSARAKSAPSNSAGETAGTSRGASSAPTLPGVLRSKINASLRVTWGRASRMRLFVIIRFVLRSCTRQPGAGRKLAAHFHQTVNGRPAHQFRETHQKVVRELRIEFSQMQAADNLFTPHVFQQALGITGDFYDELIKARAGEGGYDPGNFSQPPRGVVSLGQIPLGELPQPRLTQQAEVDGCGKCAQRLVRTDVGSSFLAPDVLLAGGEGQHKAAPALGVNGLAHQAARHLPKELFPGGQKSHVRTAESHWHSKRLRLAAHDVGLAGRFDNRQGERLRNHDDQQRALPVGDGGNLRDLLQGAEEIW